MSCCHLCCCCCWSHCHNWRSRHWGFIVAGAAGITAVQATTVDAAAATGRATDIQVGTAGSVTARSGTTLVPYLNGLVPNQHAQVLDLHGNFFI
jgi:hypothetical protein